MVLKSVLLSYVLISASGKDQFFLETLIQIFLLKYNVGREAALLQDHTAPEAKGIESPGMSQRHPLEAPDPVACKELAGQALVE